MAFPVLLRPATLGAPEALALEREQTGPMDRAEIEALYLRHGAMVLRRARAILGEEQAARDAMQEIFVLVIRQAESFRRDSSPVTWLYRITTNACLDRIRESSRRRRLLDEQGRPGESDPEASPETRTILAEILRRVPEELREIAVYYWIDEMSQDEIATLTGLSRRTIGYRLEEFQNAARRAAGEKVSHAK